MNDGGIGESSGGSNASSSGASTGTYRGSGSIDNGSTASSVDVTRREVSSGLKRGATGSDSGERSRNSESNQAGTGGGGADGGGSSPSRFGRLRKWANSRYDIGNGSTAGANSSDEKEARTDSSSLSVLFGEGDEESEPKKRRGRPPGSGVGFKKVARLAYERTAHLLITGPFWVAAKYTHWRDWEINKDEWELVKEPATNLVEKYVPRTWADNIIGASDVAMLMKGLYDIYELKHDAYIQDKLEAEQRMTAYEAQRNGIGGNSEASPNSVLYGTPKGY